LEGTADAREHASFFSLAFMGREILMPWQKRVIQLVARTEAVSSFYLTGGTALAGYYLHHRISDDLDFFSFEEFELAAVEAVAKRIKEELEADEMRFFRRYDRRQFFYRKGDQEYKVEFTQYPFKPLEPPNVFDGLKVDSKYDMAVNKLMTVFERFDPKDFVDLYFLLQEYPLERVREGVREKFGMNVDPLTVGSELAQVRAIHALPKMTVELTVQELKDFFTEQARTLRAEVLEDR
jgi:predicted nucleotidyltransferase component of viral defense system